MLQGELMEQKTLSGSIEKEIIGIGGGSSNIDSISVDGVVIEPDNNKNVNIDLSGKVDRPSKSVVQQVVTIKPNDGDTEGIGLASASSDAIFGRIPRYQNPAYDNADTPPQNMGNLVVADPTKPLHVANKKYVDENFVAKNKRLTGNRVYVSQSSVDAEGNVIYTDNTVGYATGAQSNTIPLRGNGGILSVGEPVAEHNATTKKYVDDKFAGQGTVTAGKSPQYTNDGNIAVGDAKYGYEAVKKSYVDDKFNGANKAVSFVNYSSMITSLNALANTSYSVGQNIMIVTLDVPDLWVSEIAETSVAYTYVSDDEFVNELTTNGSVQVGYYKLSALETQKVDLTEYVKNTDYATGSKAGIVSVDTSFASPYGGIFRSTLGNNRLIIRRAKFKDIENRSPNDYMDGGANGISSCCPITPANLDYSVKQVLTNDKLNGYVYEGTDYSWTDEEKKQASNLIGAVPQQKPEFDAGATRGYAYVIEQEKNAETGEYEQVQKVKKIQIQANNDTIPLRNPSGNFYVGQPTLPYECVNLGTVTATQGTSAPTEDTQALYVGELYYDTTNNKMYMCFGIDKTNKKYTWTQIIRATDYAGNSVKGVVDVRAAFGLSVDQYGRIQTVLADETTIAGKTDIYKPITANKVDYAVKQGLAYSKLEGTGFAWTDEEKASARELLGVSGGSGGLSIKSEVLTVDNAYTRLKEIIDSGKFSSLILKNISGSNYSLKAYKFVFNVTDNTSTTPQETYVVLNANGYIKYKNIYHRASSLWFNDLWSLEIYNNGVFNINRNEVSFSDSNFTLNNVSSSITNNIGSSLELIVEYFE